MLCKYRNLLLCLCSQVFLCIFSIPSPPINVPPDSIGSQHWWNSHSKRVFGESLKGTEIIYIFRELIVKGTTGRMHMPRIKTLVRWYVKQRLISTGQILHGNMVNQGVRRIKPDGGFYKAPGIRERTSSKVSGPRCDTGGLFWHPSMGSVTWPWSLYS